MRHRCTAGRGASGLPRAAACRPPPRPPHRCVAPAHAGESSERSEACAVGTWAMEAAIYVLPSLKPLFKEVRPRSDPDGSCAVRHAVLCSAVLCCWDGRAAPRLWPRCTPSTLTPARPPARAPMALQALPTDVIPRSALFACFEGDTYLLFGLGDGQLVNYRWCFLAAAFLSSSFFFFFYKCRQLGCMGATGCIRGRLAYLAGCTRFLKTLTSLPAPALRLHSTRRLDPSGPADRKKIALGTKPISLRTFRSDGKPACSGWLAGWLIG